jgi:cell division protein FtsN
MVTQQPKKKKKKKKSDPFWPIVIILSILAFTGSFWFFYMLTSKINTQSFPTTDTPKIMVTPTPEISLEGESSLLVGENTPLSTPTPESTAEIIQSQPVRTETQSAPEEFEETPPPPPSPTATPRPVAVSTPVSVPTLAPLKQPVKAPALASESSSSVYKVQVGSYASKSAAESAASQLSEKGYKTTVVERSGKYTLQLGRFDSQDSALGLAEEITQQGYEVVVRKSNP